MDKSEESRRGRRAAELLDDELLCEAFARIEADLIRDWAASDALEVDKREALYHDMKAVNRLKSYLRSIADTGKLANFNN